MAYLPVHQPTGRRIRSAKVDLALYYDDEDDYLRGILPSTYKERPAKLCPLETEGDDKLIAIPVHVKTYAGAVNQAEFQLAVCGNALLEILEQWVAAYQATRPVPRAPWVVPLPVVVALCIYGHHWTFYILYREEVNRGEANAQIDIDKESSAHAPCIVYEPFPAGQTATLLGTFHLVQFIGMIRTWVASNWMKIIKDVPNILLD